MNEEEFLDTLKDRKLAIVDAMRSALSSVKPPSPSTDTYQQFQEQNIDLSSRLRSAEAQVRAEHHKRAEQERKVLDLQDRLASSQRKIDRQKSITLARIEAQAHRAPLLTAQTSVQIPEPVVVLDNNTSSSSKELCNVSQHEKLNERLADLRDKLSETEARLQQLQTNYAKSRHDLEHLNESEVQKTSCYRALEQTAAGLRVHSNALEGAVSASAQEVHDLRAERTHIQNVLITEHEESYKELSTQLIRVEQDLARVRTARDDIHANLQIRKAQDDTKAASAREIGELADTQSVLSRFFSS